MHSLSEVRAVISDMDGVLWSGSRLLPGIRETLSLLRDRGIPYILATNNATSTFETIRARLEEGGVLVKPEEVYTSAQAAAAYLRERIPPGSIVFPIGEAGLRDALSLAGFRMVDQADNAVAVVVGLDRSVTWDRITEAAIAIRKGAPFIATNADATLPSERGIVPGAGALLAALQASTDRTPTIIGKPEPHLFLQALARLQSTPAQTLVLGDRLETDILGGQRAGMLTGLMLTGVTDPGQLDKSPIKPDWVFQDLPAFCRALRGMAA